MPGLADMEELLADISNKNIIDYMREALACYNNGAYRGCIVMSYTALFDDIRAKLGELAKVNKIAKTVWQEIEKRAGNQDVFESYMMDQIQKEGLITTAEHDRLEVRLERTSPFVSVRAAKRTPPKAWRKAVSGSGARVCHNIFDLCRDARLIVFRRSLSGAHTPRVCTIPSMIVGCPSHPRWASSVLLRARKLGSPCTIRNQPSDGFPMRSSVA